MANLHQSINKITTLEELTYKNTIIHRLQPLAKLIITVLYLIAVISYGPFEVSRLIPYLFYPIMVTVLGEIPLKPLLGRLIIALPFALFAGLSNLVLLRESAINLGYLSITWGMLSLCSLLIKTVLTVMAVLILIATTSMNDLLYAMVSLRIPSIMVLQLSMTFRYLSVLMEEIQVMYHAYILRAPKEKGIKLSDMGTFLGQLIIRSFERAERIYHAMKCRGFTGNTAYVKKNGLSLASWVYLLLVGMIIFILRIVNFSEVMGNLLL